jgi:hypothetical protein
MWKTVLPNARSSVTSESDALSGLATFARLAAEPTLEAVHGTPCFTSGPAT